MKRWPQRFLTRYMTLPSDVMLDLPRITVIGHLHVYIENHDGLVVFKENELTLKTRNGLIKIEGSAFVVKMMIPNEILLEGNITELYFIRNE